MEEKIDIDKCVYNNYKKIKPSEKTVKFKQIRRKLNYNGVNGEEQKIKLKIIKREE